MVDFSWGGVPHGKNYFFVRVGLCAFVAKVEDFEISRISRFRYRTRYFTDSGIIGSKEFVAENYRRFRHIFHSK